jgi:serine protease Do
MKQRTVLASTAALLVWLALVPVAGGQSHRGLQRSSAVIKQSVAELASPLAQSVVEIRLGEQIVALGTIVSADGLVVTKASELGDEAALNCRLWDARQLIPEVLAKDEELDLALLRLSAERLNAVDLSSQRRPTAGSFLVSVGPAGQTLGLGVVEVDARRFDLRHPKVNDRGQLGINCSSDPAQGVLVVSQVTENSAARRAGIRKGDVIVSINDLPLSHVEQLIGEVRQHKAGEQVDLIIRRGEEEIALRAKLGAIPVFEPYNQWGGGPFSKRRFGFASVIAHDTPIEPQQCGGPLLDTDGRVVGINIARALRVASYALPADVVHAFVEQHAPTAKPSRPASE